MGLIAEGDRRPRDWAYRAAFDRKDLPSLQEMVKHIRETHDTDMIEDFNIKCEQKLAGEPTRVVLDNGLEIKAVTKTGDLVVNAGLQQCINIILGTSTNRWANFGLAMNSGANPPLVTNTALDGSAGGPWYLALGLYGWKEAKGMKLFFGTITPQDTAAPFNASIVHEMGITVTSSGPILNRELFFNNPISRTTSPDGEMFKQVFIFSCVIEFCPVV